MSPFRWLLFVCLRPRLDDKKTNGSHACQCLSVCAVMYLSGSVCYVAPSVPLKAAIAEEIQMEACSVIDAFNLTGTQVDGDSHVGGAGIEGVMDERSDNGRDGGELDCRP